MRPYIHLCHLYRSKIIRIRVVLFLKGTRQMSRCGFSPQVAQILNKLLLSYETVDVLDSPEMRWDQGILPVAHDFATVR